MKIVIPLTRKFKIGSGTMEYVSAFSWRRNINDLVGFLCVNTLKEYVSFPKSVVDIDLIISDRSTKDSIPFKVEPNKRKGNYIKTLEDGEFYDMHCAASQFISRNKLLNKKLYLSVEY